MSSIEHCFVNVMMIIEMIMITRNDINFDFVKKYKEINTEENL